MYYEFEDENKRKNGMESSGFPGTVRAEEDEPEEEDWKEGPEQDEVTEESGERKPELRGRTQQRSLWNRMKRGTGRLLLSMARAWEGAQRETRRWLTVLLTAGVLLLLTVVVLLVRLNKVSKQLESVQAMSASLQEELDTVKGGQAGPPEGEVSPPAMVTKTVTPPAIATKTVTTGPTKEPEPVKDGYIVCVDAGHGGWDGGALLNGGKDRMEKDDNLRLAKLFCEALESYGIEVIMTREEDVYLELSERVDIANQAKADALISLHRNSYAGTEKVNGVEIWVHSSMPKGASGLAGSLLDAIMEVGGMENRGVKYGSMSSPKEDYAINRLANMTSMIVELGFITSDSDNAAYDDYGGEYVKEMAAAVYEWLEARQ